MIYNKLSIVTVVVLMWLSPRTNCMIMKYSIQYSSVSSIYIGNSAQGNYSKFWKWDNANAEWGYIIL